MTPETEKKIYGLLGLCLRAGHLANGQTGVENSILAGEAKLVVVTGDASDGTKKLFHDKCAYRAVPLITFGTKEALGRALGKADRSSAAITDQGFASAIMKLSEQEG